MKLRRNTCQVALLASCLICASGWAEDVPEVALRAKYDRAYQEFVEAFRDSGNASQRFTLVKRTSNDINAMLRPYVARPEIEQVLPSMERAKMIDLEPTLLAVADEHPERTTRALALLSFAKYSGNNERRKICEATLEYLKQIHGDVPYRETTFGKAADESLYYFQHLAVGAPAPATVGEDADGAVFRLADYRGKVVMLRFWGNWCPACRQMYGYERELVQKYKNQPFALIGVNSDSREECKRAQRQSNLMWRSVWDGGTTNGPVATVYRVHNWPTIVVIDATGKIRFRSEGLPREQLSRLLDRLVGEASSPDGNVTAKASINERRRESQDET